MTISRSLGCFALFLLWFLGSADAAVMQCHGSAEHWRDIAYATPPMDKYSEIRGCVAWTAWQFELPEELLYSVLYVEQGPMNGRCRINTNGTEDCGPAQINDVRLKELSRFSLTKSDMMKKPCQNVWAMGYLLRREIEKADGKIWRGVGNYHFHYSVNQNIHNGYIRKVKKAWYRLDREVARYCAQR